MKRTLILWFVLFSVISAWGLRAQAADQRPHGSLREAAKGLFEIGVGLNDRIPARAADHRLLFDRQGNPKPAFAAVMSALNPPQQP